MDNLVLLCRHHHRLVHEGGYGVRMTNNGMPKFTDPTGRTIPQAAETRFRGNVVALRRRNDRAGLEITLDTAIPLWEGEKMDEREALNNQRFLVDFGFSDSKASFSRSWLTIWSFSIQNLPFWQIPDGLTLRR